LAALKADLKMELAESEGRLEARFTRSDDVRGQCMLRSYRAYAEGSDQTVKGTEIAIAGISGRRGVPLALTSSEWHTVNFKDCFTPAAHLIVVKTTLGGR
jgi:hypothetical protein